MAAPDGRPQRRPAPDHEKSMNEPAHPDKPSAALHGDRRLELMLRAIKDYAIYLLDRDGYIISWNAGAERFKGYTADEIIGQHFSRFYTDEDRASGLPQRALATAAATGTYEAEGWRVRKDGTRFWTSVVIDPVYDDDGSLIGYAKVTRDISDKKRALEALFASEQRFRLLVQGVRDYAIFMLDPDGRITNWNAGAQAIKGYSAAEIIGEHFSRFYTPEDRARGEPARALATALRDGKFLGEGWRMRKDGTRFWASVVLDPIRDERGYLIGFAKITRDVTERREAQLALDRSRDALNQAQKMEAIGRITGGVAHDFNNLLTIIRSSAELLRRPGLPDAKRARYIDAIADTANKAAQLTRQLLAFARKQPLQPEAFLVSERLRGLEHIIRTSVGSPIKLHFELPDDIRAVDADPNQFETAVLNIVINARDAMPRGGHLTLSARQVDHIPPVRNHSGAQGDFVAVSITDTGTGIEPGTLRRIFEPFFTTKAVNKGTGLGLSQAYGFAKQSGGEIDVSTRVGEGTTFTLYLPCAKTDAVPGHKGETVTPAPTPSGIEPLSVLLVEDNETVGRFALGLLSELGLQANWATDGQSALNLMEQRNGGFDLMFSDVVMPGMNGVELACTVRKRWPTVRVVLTSGYSHVLSEQGMHGFDFLPKPYSAEALVKMLHLPTPDNPGERDAPAAS
jgi:PAS domain S-box-containing protein